MAEHTGITVDDLEGALAGARRHHPTASERTTAGSRFCYLRDPDGTMVELIEPA